MNAAAHIPVMLAETVDALAVKPGGVYVDGTLGRGGHSAEILRRLGAGTLVAIDRDEQALAETRARLEEFTAAKIHCVHGNHGDVTALVHREGLGEIDGILLDLGVSSPQLDEAGRGFSFRADGPLDMRMDRSRGLTAADLVATWSVAALAEIFRTYGEEPQARRLAQALVKEREQTHFTTTLQLADFIAKTLGRHGPHHPATRAFQALRMAVNDELGELERALAGGLSLLKPGGRFAILTFESLTDRTVKRFFAEHAGRTVSLQQGGTRWEGSLPRVRPVFRKAQTATDEETRANVRARSAKLRAAERI